MISRTPDMTSRLKAEQEIYSALFTEQAISAYVFKDYTTLELFNLSMSTVQGITHTPIEHETWTDFQQINSQSYFLKDYFPIDTNCTFINNTEIEQLHRDSEIFFAKYPNASVIISLSRVGFNYSLTQAMILIHRDSIKFGGDGLIYIFKKIDNKWVEQDQIVVMIGD